MNSPMAHDGFTIVNNQVINHEKEKEEGNLTGRNGTYPWSSMR